MINFIETIRNLFNSDSSTEIELRVEKELEEKYQGLYPSYENFMTVKLAHMGNQEILLAQDRTENAIGVLAKNDNSNLLRPAIYTNRVIHFSLNNGKSRFHPDYFPKEFNRIGMQIKYQSVNGMFDEWLIEICQEGKNYSEAKRNYLLLQTFTLAKFIGYDKLFDEKQ